MPGVLETVPNVSPEDDCQHINAAILKVANSWDSMRAKRYRKQHTELEGTGIPTVSFGYLDSDEQISLAYSAADMFILPSLEDNLPNTMLESMSCGTPVIAFNVGGIPDVLSNDVTGKLVQTGNISQMGEAILELGFNVPLREELGRNGRRLMEEEFSLGKQARRYVALYDDLLTSTASNIQTSSNRSTNERNKTDKFSLPSMTSLNVRSVAEMGPHFRSKYLPILCRSLREGLGRKMTARLSLAQR